MSRENLIVVFAVILLLLSLEALLFLSFPVTVTKVVEKQVGGGVDGSAWVDQCSQKWWPEQTPQTRGN